MAGMVWDMVLDIDNDDEREKRGKWKRSGELDISFWCTK